MIHYTRPLYLNFVDAEKIFGIINRHSQSIILRRNGVPLKRVSIDVCHHLETILTRKDDEGDQPSGGETTWTNTGAIRSGRGQHKTG